ncbi:MAG: radical SAM protein [Candidatus Methanomethylicaceae archaeon]
MVDRLPKGCEICLRGAKLVLFVTGLCHYSCYYCPLSETRRGRDVVYADEVLIKKDIEILLEGRAIDAEGTGITGGDPLIKLERTLKYIRMLKDFFGKEHHIHLYTNGMYANTEALARLKKAGLDEIRFHAKKPYWIGIKKAKLLGLYTGAEVPAIPGEEAQLKELILYLKENGADFLNINELEFTPQNAYQLKERGFELEGQVAVKGSKDLACRVLEWVDHQGIDLIVHYCSSSAKDNIQLRMRLLRRGKNTTKPYESLTKDGLIGKFLVKSPSGDPYALKRKLVKELSIPPYMLGLSRDGEHIAIPKSLVENVLKILPRSEVIYVEEYPTVVGERVTEINLSG